MTGCVTTAVLGGLINYFNAATNPVVIGKLVAVMSSIGYIGSAISWVRAGREFEKIKKDQAQVALA